MLKILAVIAILLVAAVAALMIYAATLPASFRVSRSIDVAAPPARVFPLINNLRRFDTWNPFVKKDPAIKMAYSGPEQGKGASSTWEGNGEVGQGRLEVLDLVEPSRITMRLDMVKPIAAQNTIVFSLEPEGAATRVTWSMHGERTFICKLMDAIFNMDRMVGGDFEKGLASLKTLSER